jgi:hypothetical protein
MNVTRRDHPLPPAQARGQPARLRTALTALALLALGSASTLAAPVPDPKAGDGGVPDFYLWHDDVPATPGKLLRQEPLPADRGLSEAGPSLRMLYSSTDGVDGRSPTAVSGAVFLPKGEAPAGGWPILAWAHGTTGIADICAPSFAGRSMRDRDYLNHWLAQGYAIVASDYQGLGTPGLHPYMQTRPAAYSVLDSVRAALSGVPSLANKVVVIGQSQGGGAAFATAGFAAAYAPDIDLRGTVATGLPYLSMRAPSVAAEALDTVDPTIAYALYIGIEAAAGGGPSLDQLFTPAALPLVERARTTCVGPLFRAVNEAGLTRRGALKPGFTESLKGLAPALAYPTLKLSAPLFVGTGAADNDVRPENQLALVNEACAAGSIIEAHLYAGRDHGATVMASVKDSTPFIRKVMAGEPVAARCEPQPE